MTTALYLLLVLFLVLANGFFVASEFALVGVRRSRVETLAVTPEQELMALDLSWHQAVAARDLESLGRLLADDYRFDLDARRMLTKAQEVEAIRASDAFYAIDPFKLKDVSVRIEGDRASVSGILIVSPKGRDKSARRRYFYTRTFVRRDGRWQALASGLVTLSNLGD